MKQHEFLAQLKIALENELNEQNVNENLEFYKNYIQGELQKGIAEEEVIEQLGDPWAIAKTVILTEKMEEQEGSTDSEVQNGKEKSYDHVIKEVPKWKIILIVIAIIAALLVLGSMAFGVITLVLGLVMRFALPIMVFWLVIRLITRK